MLAKNKQTFQLKNFAILTKKNINNSLSLKRSKSITFTDKHYLALLLLISIFGTFAEGGGYVCNWFGHLPKGDSLLDQLQKLKEEDIHEQFDKLFKQQFQNIFRNYWRKPKVVLSIDMTEKPTYSKYKKESENIVGGKEKASTHHFFRFATVQIADKKIPLTLYAIHCKKGISNEEIIEKLVIESKKLVRIKCLLIDRGFYDTKVFNKLEQLGIKFLMPSKSDNRTEMMFNEYLKSDYEVNAYFTKNNNNEYADLNLIMIRFPDGKELGYVTNMHFIKLHRAKYYIRLYKKRWNIETGYRMQNLFFAKTCSINPSVRFFYFCYSVAMHNLWITLRHNNPQKSFRTPALLFIFVLLITIIAEFLDFSLIGGIS